MKSKNWGTAELLYQNDFMYLEKICVIAEGRSSIHLHRNKVNLFIVESGELRIYTDAMDYVLTSGKQFTVSPKIEHQFYALTPVIAYEVYYGNNVDVEDIERFEQWS